MLTCLNSTTGQVPLKFRSAVRQQIEEHYPNYSFWATRKTKVTAIVPLAKGFRIYDDRNGIVTAKRVILATGITDVLPNKQGFAEAFGRGMFWCPWCDGHDYKDRKMVVYGKLASAIGTALNMRKLTTDITIVTGGPLTKEDKDAAEARWPGWEAVVKNNYKIPIRENDIVRVERTNTGMEPRDDEYRVHFNAGGPLVTNGIIIHVGTRQTSTLHQQLRLEMAGNSVKVKDNMESSIGGLYVVGDANSDGSTNAYHAMWSAKRAAVTAHGMLLSLNLCVGIVSC
jgi:thioredoxin reductase